MTDTVTGEIPPPSLHELAPDLVKALAEMTELPKGRTANVGTYSYKYADLGDALSYVRPILGRHNLAVFQSAEGNNGTVSVWTTVLHSSGQRLDFPPLTMPAGNSPQAAGSALTYARRYQLLAALGLATEDDDGQAAAPKQQQRKRRTTQTEDTDACPPTRAQTRKAMVLFGEIGLEERADRLDFTSAVLDREVPSWNTVFGSEADRVITALENRKAHMQGGV